MYGLKWDNDEEIERPCRKLKPKSVTDSFRHEDDADESKEGKNWSVNDAMHSCPKYNDAEEKTSYRKLLPEAVSDSFRHENDRSKEGEDWGVNDAMHSCSGGDKCGCKACHIKNCCQKWDNEEKTSCRKLKPKADRNQKGEDWDRHDAMQSYSFADDKGHSAN